VTFKQILQRVAAPAAMTAAIVGGSLVAAPSASAAISDCPTNMVCVFQDDFFGGRMVGNTGDVSNVGDYMNDRTSSLVNDTWSHVCFYADVNYQGELLFRISPNTDIAGVGDDNNDRISSWRKC
jgi:Peptidase inhibitor family I36